MKSKFRRNQSKFHWPLCENMAEGMQKPECAKALDMWVKDRNGINGVDVSDQDWPECDSDTCGYKSLQEQDIQNREGRRSEFETFPFPFPFSVSVNGN